MPNPIRNYKQVRTSAGLNYPTSGRFHGGHDKACPTGTPLYAPTRMVILGFNRGVAPNRPGHNPGPGSPSNWILAWCEPFPGYPQGFTMFFQHLLDVEPVARRVGKRVKAGTLIGRTDNTGNSTGPHLHWHTMLGKERDRYRIYSDRSVLIYPPTKPVREWERWWRGVGLSPGDQRTPGVRRVKRLLGMKNRGSKYGRAMAKRVKAVQRRAGLPTTGHITPATRRAIVREYRQRQ